MSASEKNSISTNRKSTTRCSSSHRLTLCITPKSPKGCLKTRIFTFGVALHFYVAGNRRHFKLHMWVEHSKSQHTDDKTSRKGRGYCHVTSLIFWKINDNISKTVRNSRIGEARNFKFLAYYTIINDFE